MLKSGDVDAAYRFSGPLGEEVRRTSEGLHRDDVRFKYVIMAGSLLPCVPSALGLTRTSRRGRAFCRQSLVPGARNDFFTKEHPCLLLDYTAAAAQDQPHLFTVVYIGPHTPAQGR